MMVRRKRARSLTEAIDRTSSAAISDTRTFATTSCRNNSSSSGVQRTFRFFDTPRSLICIHLQPDLASRVDFTRFDRNPNFVMRCRIAFSVRWSWAPISNAVWPWTTSERSCSSSSTVHGALAIRGFWTFIFLPSAGGGLQSARDRSALSPAGVSLIALPCFSLRLSIQP